MPFRSLYTSSPYQKSTAPRKWLFFVISLLSAVSCFASSPDTTIQDTLVGDKLYYLELKGTIKRLDEESRKGAEALDSAIIRIYNDKGVLVAEHMTSRKGRCNFKLPLNRKFIVEVSKQGFISKKIEVNTKVPPEKKLAYIFPFSLEIFEEIPGMDVSMLDKPIARISYLFTISQFDYDNLYTNKVNHELKMKYREYYQLKKMAADSAVNLNKAGVQPPPPAQPK